MPDMAAPQVGSLWLGFVQRARPSKRLYSSPRSCAIRTPEMFSLDYLFSVLSASPAILEGLTLATLVAFIDLASALRPTIIHAQNTRFDPEHVPARLGDDVCTFISHRLNLPFAHVDALWDALRVMIWTQGAAWQIPAGLEGTVRFHDQLQLDCKLSMLYAYIDPLLLNS